jgi:3-deoxy-7-phosphoheptulonate synthase
VVKMNWSRLSPSQRAEATLGWEVLEGAAAPWRPDIWHSLPPRQQPDWATPGIAWVRESLFSLPALSDPADVRALRGSLERVQAGDAFLLQAGDCAEPFGTAAVVGAREKHRLLGRMSTLLSDRIGLPVVTAGRLGGQFGKPRSQSTELVGGRPLPSFRGLIVNGPDQTEAARRPHAPRLLDAYSTAHRVFGELHHLATRGDGPGIPLTPAQWWSTPPAPLSSTVDSYGQTSRNDDGWVHNGLWTSHEALVLDYEEPLTRRDEDTGEWFLTSTHLPWVGARTNQPDGAHVMFLSGVANPIACKVGPDTDPAQLVQLCARLDPERTPGRLTLISRQGAGVIRDRLPQLVEAVRRAGHPVIWVCDPMHGNTVKTSSGLKTRHYEDIVDELRGFFAVMAAQSQWPGGVHLEVAADDVTECVGGGGPDLSELPTAYRSLCDPRLNDVQALSLAREIADLLTTAAVARRDDAGLLTANT